MTSAPPETSILTVLPRGRHAAPRPVVREAQRGRMLAAMVQAVADKGYARVAVADVIERAGVSRKTFYEQFANKDDCFLAAYDATVDELLATIDEALEALAPDWLAAHRAAVGAYLETLAASPQFAKAFLIEVLGAGPRPSTAAPPSRTGSRLSSGTSTVEQDRTSPRFPRSRRTRIAPPSAPSTSSSPRTCSNTALTRCPSSRTRSSTFSLRYL